MTELVKKKLSYIIDLVVVYTTYTCISINNFKAEVLDTSVSHIQNYVYS